MPSKRDTSDSDIEVAVAEVLRKYDWAKKQEWVKDPVGYALYHVWDEWKEIETEKDRQ